MKKGVKFLLLFLLSFILVACSAITPQTPIVEKTTTIANIDKEIKDTIEESIEESSEEEKESSKIEISETENSKTENLEEMKLAEDGVYSSKEEVAFYLSLYGHLPSNYITKKEAEKLGWKGGSLEPFAPGMCIGGNRFGNYEGLLPEKEGRFYTECDIDTLGAEKRGAKRIVFSNDGLIYYTEDHYQSFELLYGEEEE